MPFSNPNFPNQTFKTIEELKEALAKRKVIEAGLEREEEKKKITATIIPHKEESSFLEKRIASLEKQLGYILSRIREIGKKPETNKDNLPIGMILKGKSKGQEYTLEVLEKGYLCSTGELEETLSAAAERVSGNRRSGWAFWCDGNGRPVGEITGKFFKAVTVAPFEE